MATLRSCSGLVTFPNEINKKDGSLEIADNIVIDRDDSIEPRRGFEDFGAETSELIKQQFVYKGRLFRHYETTLEYDSTGSGSFLSYSGDYTETETGLRIKAQEAKSNLFFTTSEGIKKISATSASNLTSSIVTNAGGVKAVDLNAVISPTVGGFLPPQSKVAYRLVWGIRDNNNNVILGSPSARFVLENPTEDQTTNEQFTINLADGADSTPANLNGKYIIFSSKETDYFVWFDGTGTTAQPNETNTVGRVPIKVTVTGLTTQQMANIIGNTLSTSVGAYFDVSIGTKTVVMLSKEVGINLTNAAEGTAITNVAVTTDIEGNTISASSANALLNFTIPNDVDSTNYFYQIYRSGVATVTEGLTLDEIDPGDEMNLVLDDNVTSSEISAGSVTGLEDITTEDFRSTGTFLYTNPNTGSGILQANEKPPIAKDIALFRNSMFYANTKSVHRKTINLLTTLNFVAGTSKFVIANASVAREYTFVGDIETSDVTADTYANTTGGGYFLLYSANDEREYYVWLDKGSNTDPALANKVGIRARIFTGDTAATVAQRVKDAIEISTTDFDITILSNVLTISNYKNGYATDGSVVGLGGSWSFVVTNQGIGEDAGNNEVLLSNIVSVGQSIDETARSLVRIVNNDSLSPVNAFYLSGPDDLPGIILFENRSLDDVAFYLAVNQTAISTNFNPTLPVTKAITNISVANPTQITSLAHGLTSGSNIYIYGTNSTPALLGVYVNTFVDVNNFTVPVQVTVLGTQGFFFSPTEVSDNETSSNRVFFSKIDQPEAVPIVNFLDIGPKDDPIKRIISLRDNLFVLKEDAVYIITGTSAPNFGSRLLDNSAKIFAADSAVVLNNKIYALSSQGIISITESGVDIISRPIENLILRFANFKFNYKTICFGVASESDRAFFLWAPTNISDTVATQCFRYNVFTQTWTRWTNPATCGIVNNEDDKIYIADGTRNFSQQERKNLDRTDYSDRSFSNSIIAGGILDDVIKIGSVVNVVKGDVVLQQQYVTISQYNRLLKTLDLDVGLDDTDYYSSLVMIAGDNLKDKLDNLNTKLVADDTSGTITAVVFSTSFSVQQTQFNDMIDELNDPLSDAFFSNYDQSVGSTNYEVIIKEVNIQDIDVTVVFELPFIEGPCSIYKSINTKTRWAPQHFGAPDQQKQIREGTFIFDQNNFYGATVSYATDLSQNFESIEFLGRGNGVWGAFDWGDNTWGGEGSEVPMRTYIPLSKQRCRYIRPQFEHNSAREFFRIIGVSFEPRLVGSRAYR